MEWYEIELNGRHTVTFPSRTPLPSAALDAGKNDFAPSKIGGIIKRGDWAWLASGCTLEVVALRSGHVVASYEFTDFKGYDNCCIRSVEEIMCDANNILLAVCLESFRAVGGGCSFVALYAVADSKVLSCVELPLHLTSARYVGAGCCRRSLLQNFDGCLALGSEEGVVVLLDLNMCKVLEVAKESLAVNALTGCHITDFNLPLAEIHRNFRQCRRDGVHFGLQIEVIESPCAIHCMLPIDLILGLAIGLEDGRLAFYDLAELQIFYIAKPQAQQIFAPLVKMNYLEPLDDPRPCLYVYAVHESDQNLSATVHTLMYEKRLVDEDNLSYFEAFQTGAVRLELPLEVTKSKAIACQSISKVTKLTTRIEEDANCLCALFWYSSLEEKNKLLIFDLNQWYKNEMPNVIDRNCNYLAGYVLSGQLCAMDAYLNPSTIAHFNSLQRFEEHFYPNSLSFDCVLLMQNSCRSYTWLGAQNKLINILRSSSAAIFLEPDQCFKEILRTRLLPQFSELNVNSTFSRNAKYETILSVALEHNCFSLLRDCAKCWADGSFMGENLAASTGISLSTLTEWIWKRATHIKERCNDLCKGLFDYAGYPLDKREQKELGFITRQLKLLADLLGEVLKYSKRHIPNRVFGNLDAKFKSLRMASEYQEIILWLLNIGLLPEIGSLNKHSYGVYKMSGAKNEAQIVYPYTELKKLYTLKRTFFGRISENFVSKKTGSCRLLFIDSFIEHECKGDVLREYWLENGGNGLYPPTSIESMLRIMLVPDVHFESKCAILLYFFLDLHTSINEQTHKELIASFIKFPSVFKLTASLIKTVQSFWNLDHGQFVPAVDEFISPFHNNQNYPQWMLELLIEGLLTQNASNLALRILEARPNLISPVLKLKTLLSNELISEAFHFARSKHDDALLELFFTCCLCAGKYGVIRDLALSEKEGQLVQRILKRSKTRGAENLHFVYLLQKSKYIEAVTYLDDLSRGKSLRTHYTDGNASTDTPNLVLSAYNTTMTPVTQGLTDVYFRIRNKIKKKEADNKSPVPLSCQLIKQNANSLLGGIYHSSALSAHFATYYWGEMEGKKHDSTTVLNSNNAPFLRKPQVETQYMDYAEQGNISYPQPYKITEKRTLIESDLHESGDVSERTQSVLQENPKKRRRLLGEEIVNDLSHFVETCKGASRLNANGFSFMENTVGKSKPAIRDTQKNISTVTDDMRKVEAEVEGKPIDFLTQPLATPRRRLPLDNNVNNYTVKSLASSDLHSILKTNTPERVERGISARYDATSDEGKNLRFKLPAESVGGSKSPEKEKLNAAKLPTTTKREDLLKADEGESFEVVVEGKHINPEEDGREKYKEVARSISVDSNDDGSSHSNSGIDEETFYSPVSSQHNSMVVESPCLSTEKYGFLGGPQPRKPLMRLSAERSEKSPTRRKTIEIECCSQEKSEISDKMDNVQRRKGIFDINTQPSSGYVSLNIKSSSSSSSHTPLIHETTSMKSIDSKISEFTPKSTSSKMFENQPNFVTEKVQSSSMKLSECSTFVGSFTSIDNTESKLTLVNSSPSENQTQDQMHNTTLGMSSCDLTTMISKISAPIESVASGTAGIDESKCISKTSEEHKQEQEGEGDMQTDENVEIVNESAMFEEALNIQGSSSVNMEKIHRDSDVDIQKVKGELNVENSDDVIVLSSSSASSSIDNESEGRVLQEETESENDSECGIDLEDDDSDNDGENYEDDDEVEDESDSDLEIDEGKYVTDEQKVDNMVEYSRSSSKSIADVEVEMASELNSSTSDINCERRIEKPASIESNDTEEETNQKKYSNWDNVVVEEIVEGLSADSITVVGSEAVVIEEYEKKDRHEKDGEQHVRVVKFKDEEVIIEEMEVSSYTETLDEVLNVVTEISNEKFEVASAMVMSDANKSEKQAPDVMESVPAEMLRDEDESKMQETQGRIGEISEDTSNVSQKSDCNMATKVNQKSAVEADTTEMSLRTDEKKVGDSETLDEEQISLHVDDEDLSDKETDKKVDQMNAEINKTEKVEKDSTITTTSPTPQHKGSIGNSPSMDFTPYKRKRSKLIEMASVSPLTPRTRRTLRGESVPPSTNEVDTTDVSAVTPHRRKRGISVPPQVSSENADTDTHTPCTRRNVGTNSQQLQSEINDECTISGTGTPRMHRNTRGTSVPYERSNLSDSVSTLTRTNRGTSVPPSEIGTKIVTRRRSALLEVISEHTPVLDSPSARTRSRLRLNSLESELDTSIASGEQPRKKHTRRYSVSSDVSEQSQTPKRKRYVNVVDSQTELTGTPKVLGVVKHKTSRGENAHIELAEKNNEKKKGTHKAKEEEVKEDSSMYSSTRRLTRTQLAMLEKSAALQKSAVEIHTDTALISPPVVKRISKRRGSRSTVTPVPDSDDVESISSHVSNASSPSKRRVTRSSVKDKEEVDDDLASVASSIGSERLRKRRSKDDKSSPNVTLTTINEDEGEEHVERKKRGRPPKKTYSEK